MFIPFMRFLPQSLVSRGFPVLLMYSLFLLSLIFPIFLNTCNFLFLGAFGCFLDLVDLLLPLFFFFPFFIISMTHFSMPNLISYIMTACSYSLFEGF